MNLQDDEFVKDGLVWCKKCNSPRQLKINLGGQVILPRILCHCQAEKRDREEALRKHREFLDQVARNRSVGMEDPSLRKYTFQNDKGGCPQILQAKRYVDSWKQMQENNIGLLLWGDVGTGKTYLAGCIANALLDQGVPVMMTNFSRILNTLTGLYQGDRNRFIDSFRQYNLLILDDLGIERSSEFALEQVFGVIDSRYRSKLPMIITTNLTLRELKHPESVAKARIYDRILESCVPIRVSDRNIRQQNAEENLKKAREILR